MKSIEQRKSLPVWLVLIPAILMQFPAYAEVSLGQVLGTAWTIGNTIVGETTLTPAYGVKTWYQHMRGGEDGSSITRKVTRDLLGHYFYYTKQTGPGGTVIESEAPFPVSSMNKLNLTCSRSLGGGKFAVDTTIQTHTVLVWMAKVEQTGLWPDDGPWTVWLKTSGYKTGCTPRIPQTDYFYWTPATIGKSGSQTVSLGTPSCVLNYPFYLAKDFYK